MATNILTHGRVTWTNIIQPTTEDLRALSAFYPQFHALNLQDCLTEQEMPKLDHSDDYLFLVVQFPVWDSLKEFPEPAEIDLFIARGTLVTSHRGQVPVLEELFSKAQMDENFRAGLMGQGASPMLYHLLNDLLDACNPLIHDLGHRLREIEEDLFRYDTRTMLGKIVQVRRALIALRHILRPQLEVLRALERGSWSFIHEDLDIYWGDLRDHLIRMNSQLDEYSEVVAGLSETVDTMASHRIDDVVRLLTVATVVTLPLSLLATIFGMNVLMPFADHPVLFYMLIIAGLGFTLLIVWYLYRRRWW